VKIKNRAVLPEYVGTQFLMKNSLFSYVPPPRPPPRGPPPPRHALFLPAPPAAPPWPRRPRRPRGGGGGGGGGNKNKGGNFLNTNPVRMRPCGEVFSVWPILLDRFFLFSNRILKLQLLLLVTQQRVVSSFFGKTTRTAGFDVKELHPHINVKGYVG